MPNTTPLPDAPLPDKPELRDYGAFTLTLASPRHTCIQRRLGKLLNAISPKCQAQSLWQGDTPGVRREHLAWLAGRAAVLGLLSFRGCDQAAALLAPADIGFCAAAGLRPRTANIHILGGYARVAGNCPLSRANLNIRRALFYLGCAAFMAHARCWYDTITCAIPRQLYGARRLAGRLGFRLACVLPGAAAMLAFKPPRLADMMFYVCAPANMRQGE